MSSNKSFNLMDNIKSPAHLNKVIGEIIKIINEVLTTFKISEEELSATNDETPENLMNKFSWVPIQVVQEALDKAFPIPAVAGINIPAYLECNYQKFDIDVFRTLILDARSLATYGTYINHLTKRLLKNRNKTVN